MEISDSSEPANPDFSPATPLEISQEVAEQADELLRDFAEDAALETALIVDLSGALVTGISAEENVTVELISALVAGASGAMKTLVKELGETGEIESLHQGSERTIYLRELVGRFTLVGVADSKVPVGVIREKSNQVRGALADLLKTVRSSEPIPEEKPETVPVTKSLREVAMARAAERAAKAPPVIDDDDPLAGLEDPVIVDDDDFDLEKLTAFDEEADEEVAEDQSEEASIFEADDDEELIEEEVVAEPIEIIESIEFDEPEIVIEKADGSPAESPFEVEEDDEPVVDSPIILEDGAPVESIFELESEDESEETDLGAESVVEELQLDGNLSGIFEVDSDEGSESIEVIEALDDEGEEEVIFELDEEDDEESSPEEQAIEPAEEEEVRGSGPFYF